MTEVVGGPDIHVDRLSTLQLLCRVSSGNKTPAFIIWQRGDKVRLLPFLLLVLLTLRQSQILKFDGGETSAVQELGVDGSGRHLSTLTMHNIQMSDSVEYSCQVQSGALSTDLHCSV